MSGASDAQTIALSCKNIENPSREMSVYIDLSKKIMKLDNPQTNRVSINNSNVVGIFADGFITVDVNRYTLKANVVMKTDQATERLNYECSKVDVKKF